MLTLFRIKGGQSYQVKLGNRTIHAFPTRSEAKAFIAKMNKQYGELL
jgi:hypothetical protein